jgi:ankyrin repeat protein
VGTARRYLQLGGSPNVRYDHDIEKPYLPPLLPLIESAVRNELEIAILLLEYGANVDMQDWSDATALYMASKLHNQAMVRLLEYGADIRFSYGFHPRQSEIEKRVETYSRRVKGSVRVVSAQLWRGEVTYSR